MTSYTNEIVHQRKRQICIWGKTFHITPSTPETREQLVTPRLCERSLAGGQQISTILPKKHSLPLAAKERHRTKSLPPALAGVRLLSDVRLHLHRMHHKKHHFKLKYVHNHYSINLTTLSWKKAIYHYKIVLLANKPTSTDCLPKRHLFHSPIVLLYKISIKFPTRTINIITSTRWLSFKFSHLYL